MATALNPREAGYPFSATNALEGFIYYTRLSQGSANGLAMVALESVPATTDGFMSGFYTGGDDREEIDSTARFCAQRLTTGVACDHRRRMMRHQSRPLADLPFDATQRLEPRRRLHLDLGRTGGPSLYCDVPANGCASAYSFRQYNEAGATIQERHHSARPRGQPDTGYRRSWASEAGFISIFDVPNVNTDTQFYGFSFNSANPVANPSLTWDAIFEGYILP